MKAAIYLSLVCLFAVGCSSLPPSVEQSELFSGFSLSNSYEILSLRVPVYVPSETSSKATTTVNPDGSSSTKTESSTSSAVNHPLCLDLGNGLYLDTNGVIFLSVLDLYELKEDIQWEIEARFGGWSGYHLVKRDGDLVLYEDHQSLIKIKDSATINDYGATRETGPFTRTVEYSPEKSVYTSNATLFSKNRESVKIDDTTFSLAESMVSVEGGVVYIDPRRNAYDTFPTRIVENNGAIEIYYNKTSFFFFKNEYLGAKLHKTDNGFILFQKGLFGFKKKTISFNGTRIEFKEGMLTRYYELK